MSKPRERELNDVERGEIDAELADARSLLPAGVDATDAEAVVEALVDMVEAIRDKPKTAPRTLDETGFLFGVLFGDAMCSVARFQWAHLTYDNGFESIGVVTWDRSFVCFPFHFIFDILSDKARENTLPTLWQMIQGERGPGIVAQAYLPLS